MKSKIKASDHEDYLKMTFLSLVLPFVGGIVGVVFLTRDNVLEKRLGEHMVAISVLGLFVGWFLWGWFLSSAYSV